jgi:hypothetical protein
VLRLGRLVYGRLLFAVQILVLAVRLCLKFGFRHIAQQPRQSLIATTSRRSALDCGRRSSPNNRYFFKGVPASPRCRIDIRKQNFRRRCQLKREFLYLCAPKSTKTLRPHKTTHKLTPIHFGFVDLRPLSSHYFYELGRPNVDVIIVQNN